MALLKPMEEAAVIIEEEAAEVAEPVTKDCVTTSPVVPVMVNGTENAS